MKQPHTMGWYMHPSHIMLILLEQVILFMVIPSTVVHVQSRAATRGARRPALVTQYDEALLVHKVDDPQHRHHRHRRVPSARPHSVEREAETIAVE